MSELLAAFLGAVVGGILSLVGSVFVNKMQITTTARMRLYDELLPRLESAIEAHYHPQVREDHMAEEVTPELLEEVRRASAISGRFERKAAHNLTVLWRERNAPTDPDPPDPPGNERPPSMRMLDEIQAFSHHLAAKLRVR